MLADVENVGSVGQSEGRRGGSNGADMEEEASTIAIIRGNSFQDKTSIESSSVSGEGAGDVGEDANMWRRPWTREEMEPLSITMKDFEVDFSSHQFVLASVPILALAVRSGILLYLLKAVMNSLNCYRFLVSTHTHTCGSCHFQPGDLQHRPLYALST